MPTAERNGVRLFFEDEGAGPAILFHTGGCGDGRMWSLAGYTAALPGSRHLLMDHRGHGRSDAPQGAAAHRIGEYVADVVAVLDAAGVDTTAFVGYSAGATVGYRFAAEHPERCRALVAVGGFPEPEDDPSDDIGRAAGIREIGTRSVIEQMSATEAEAAPAWLVDHLCTTDTEMFALIVEGWSEATNGWELLPRITCPALVVVGAEEADPGAAHRSADRMPHGQAVVIPSFGHLQTFWHSEVTAPLIRDFLG